MQLRPAGRCQYITSADKPFVWCDAPALPRKSYCSQHQALCFVNVRSLLLRKLEREKAVAQSLAEAA